MSIAEFIERHYDAEVYKVEKFKLDQKLAEK